MSTTSSTSLALVLLLLAPGCRRQAPAPESSSPAVEESAVREVAVEESAVDRSAEPALREARLDGRRVAYLDLGQGSRAVVLVHGWASDRRSWGRQAASLSRSHRVIAVDLPGHGASEEPARPYSMDLFAEALAAVLDEAGLSRAVFVGHSNGTPAIRQFWRRHPERVAGLVFVDGPLMQVMTEASVRPFLAAFESEGWRERVVGFVDSMPRSELSDADFTEIREMASSQPQHAVAGGLRAVVADDIWTEEKIDAPCLVLKAAQPTWSPAYAARVHELIPGVDYRSWTGVSHYLQFERADELNALLEDFLARASW